MANLEQLVVELTAETSGLRAELSRAVKVTSDATGKMDDAIKSFSANGSKNTDTFTTALAVMAGTIGSSLVLGAVEHLQEAVSFLADEFKKGVEMAAAEDQALTKLANSLAISGQYSKVAMEGMQSFVESMERATGVDATLIAQNLSLLSSLTKLSSQGLQTAQKAALDMSAALGMDLNTATMLVAKGIEGNTSAFKRWGITIQDGGSTAQNFTNVMTALNKNFGGAAKGAMETYSGAVIGLHNAYEDLLKAVGRSVTQNPVVIAMINELTTDFHNLTDSLDGSLTPMKAVALTMITIADGAKLTVDAVGAVIDHLKVLEAGAQSIILVAAALGDALGGSIDASKEIAGQDPWKATKQSYDDLYQTVTSEPVFKGISEDLDHLAQTGADAFIKIDSASKTVTPTVNGNTEAVKQLTEAQLAHNAAAAEFAKGLADQQQTVTAYYDFEQEMLDANYELKLTKEQDYWDQKMSIIQEREAAELQFVSDAYQAGNITAGQFLDARTALENKHALEQKKFQNDYTKYEKETQKQRLQNMSSIFGEIATLSDSHNRELAAIGKAAAITQATIDGFLAVSNALAQVPYPANFVVAALVGVAAAANVAKIAGVPLAGGMTEVPGIGSQDNFPAVLAPGERVVDADTNRDLKSFLARGGAGGTTVVLQFSGANFYGAPTSEWAATVVEAINEAAKRGNTNGFVTEVMGDAG